MAPQLHRATITMLTTITYLQQQQLDLSKITIQDNISPRSSLTLAAIDLSGLYDRTQPKTLQMHTSKSTYIFTHIYIFFTDKNFCNFLSQLLQWFQYENTWYTKSNGTVHTSTKACFTSVTTQIRICDLDRHQNSIICLSTHCQSSLKILYKSVWKFMCKVDQYWHIRVLFMISECKFKELEVVVKFYEYYSIFYSIIWVWIVRLAKRHFACTSISSTSTSTNRHNDNYISSLEEIINYNTDMGMVPSWNIATTFWLKMGATRLAL